MAENEAKFIIYLKFKTTTEMLKVISSFGQSSLGVTPILYVNEDRLFMLSPFGEGIIVNYTIIKKESAEKLKGSALIKLEGSTEELTKRGIIKDQEDVLEKLLVNEKKPAQSGVQLLYIPIIEVEKTSLKFPL
jgi:hypothetical protein